MGRPKKAKYSAIYAEIVGCAKESGVYNPGMIAQYQSLAGAMLVQRKCIKEIEGLEETFVKGGRGAIVPHPAFRTLQQITATIAALCKSVGLTNKDLSVDGETDPLADVMNRMREAGSDDSGQECDD